MVVAGASDVLVKQAGTLGTVGRGLILAVLQDGGDRTIRASTQRQGAGAGGIEPFGAVTFFQAEDTDAGAEALFGVWPGAQDDVDQGRRIAAHPGRLAPDPVMGPVAIAAMRTRHVVRHGGPARWSGDAGAGCAGDWRPACRGRRSRRFWR